MTAQELRIGNLVKQGNHIREVDFKNDRRIFEDLDIIEGIPLTEELLIKFGFERIDTGHLIAWSINDFHLLTTAGELNILITFNNSSVDIKTVHHLQNLYFALTNKELTIKGHDSTNLETIQEQTN